MTLRHLLLLLTLLLTGHAASASDNVASHAFITDIQFYQEPAEQRLSLAQAQQHFAEGDFHQAERPYLTFGISDRAVWVRLLLSNPSGSVQTRRLTAGLTWIENIEMYQVTGDAIRMREAGDSTLADEHLLPAVGIVFHVDVPTGQSEIWLRAQSYDPITMPIQLLTLDQAQHSDSLAHLGSGLLYGILLALAGFQLVLYSILKHRNALFYTIYISTFVIMNFGYSGYGFTWLYPHSPIIQNYSTLYFMVLHAVCGLVFMRNFLQLNQVMPSFARSLKNYMWMGVLMMSVFVIMQSHFLSALWSFGYITLTTLIMITASIMCFGKVEDARYFLLAVCCSMIGLCVTSLSNLGFLPYTKLGYHAAEIGVVCEAIILAVVVTHRLKAIEDERITTKFLATYDPLTKLFNRHTFEEMASNLLQQGKPQKPLSLAILDLDHFKLINDNYGHYVGDLGLKHIANLLQNSVRSNDIVARWGGEELIVLMPDTRLIEALTLSEALRLKIETSSFQADDSYISITASIGLACSSDYPTLEQLFKAADERLYLAKNLGRNRVEFVLPSTQTAEPAES